MARGFYLACVEHLKDERDGRGRSIWHRDQLPGLVRKFREYALRLDLGDVATVRNALVAQGYWSARAVQAASFCSAAAPAETRLARWL